MPHNIALLRADIEDELAKLEQLARVFATVRLDWDRERLVTLRFDATLGLVKKQVTTFLQALDALE